MEWNPIFTEQKETYLLRWEGDLDRIKALRLIKGMGDELTTAWLDSLLKYVTESGMPAVHQLPDIIDNVSNLQGQPNMIWTYGGPRFLRRLAQLDTGADIRVTTIIRSVLGLKAGTSLRLE